MFRDQNLLYSWSRVDIETVDRCRIRPRWEHIQVLRVHVDEGRSLTIYGDGHTELVAKIISTCLNLKTLGLYYSDWHSNFHPINKVVVNLLEKCELNTFGIYGSVVLNDGTGNANATPCSGTISGPTEVLHDIAASEKASRALKKLDIVTEWMGKPTYALLQSSPFPNLESLTVRHSFRHSELWNEDPAERNKWSPSANLVCLRLINCQTAYSPDIPLMVRQFEHLQELMVSTCGYGEDFIPAPRTDDWSADRDALCQVRKPLRIFALEHMMEWEILALGTIPTTTLVSTNVQREDLINALEFDPMLFPGLRVLHVLPDRLVFPPGMIYPEEEEEREEVQEYIKERKERLEAVCARRRVELRRDAVRMRPCYCCGGY